MLVCFDFYSSIKVYFEFFFSIFREYFLESLFEEGGVEGIIYYYVIIVLIKRSKIIFL